MLIIHELVYFGSFLPFWLADFLPFLHKYKIQPDVRLERHSLTRSHSLAPELSLVS